MMESMVDSEDARVWKILVTLLCDSTAPDSGSRVVHLTAATAVMQSVNVRAFLS